MLKIVINENDKSILDILQLVLEQEDYTVISLFCIQTSQLLHHIKAELPNLAVLDFKNNGEQAIKQLRAIKNTYPHLPVIAISCNANIAVIAKIIGFDAYIAKPFDIDEIVPIISKTLVKLPRHTKRLEKTAI